MRIIVTNVSHFDKSEREWFENISNYKYKIAGWNSSNSFADIEGLTFGYIPFKDRALTQVEGIKLKETIEERIKVLLEGRIPETIDFPRIQFLGETINLNSKPTAKNSQDATISDLFNAYQICQECLRENKPVYLSNIEDSWKST